MIRCGKDGAVLTCCHVLDHGEKPEVLALINDNDEPVEWGEQTYVCAACNNAFLNHKTDDDIPDDLCVVHKGCLEQVERKEWWK